MKHLDVALPFLPLGSSAFNPSLVQDGGRMFMSYRWGDAGGLTCSNIGQVELDKNWRFIDGTQRENALQGVPPCEESHLVEDMRFITAPGEPSAQSVVFSRLNDKGRRTSCQGLAIWGYETIYPPAGSNLNFAQCGNEVMTSEKNWTFFWHKGEMLFLYSLQPLDVRRLNGERVALRHSAFNCHGETPRGGTNLIPWGKDRMLGMFHAHQVISGVRHYTASFYVLDTKDWKITHVSGNPFLNSTPDGVDTRPPNLWWRPQVVFPTGLVEYEPGKIVIAAGWQDCVCRLYFTTQEEIERTAENRRRLVTAKRHSTAREVLADPYQQIPGGYDVTIRGTRVRAKTWRVMAAQGMEHGITPEEAMEALCHRLPANLKKLELTPDPGPPAYCHSGDLGDILACLPAVKHMGGGIFYLCSSPLTKEMTPERIAAIRPLLEAQPYITEVREHDGEQVTVDFSQFRSQWSGRHLAEIQANFAAVKPDFDLPWLTVDPLPNGKIIVARTQRHRSPAFPWKQFVRLFAKEMLFIGHPEEHKEFCTTFGKVEYVPTADLLQAARLIAGSRCLISNQTSIWWIGEGLKHRAVLEKRRQMIDDSEIHRANASYIYDGLFSDEMLARMVTP